MLRAQQEQASKESSVGSFGGLPQRAGAGAGPGANVSAKAGEAQGHGDDMVLDFSNSPPDSRPGTSSGNRPGAQPSGASINGALEDAKKRRDTPVAAAGDGKNERSGSRGNGHSGNGNGNGSVPTGDVVERTSPVQPKRRWTVDTERD